MEKQLWEGGHLFKCSSVRHLQVMVVALRQMGYQHLLSLHSMQLDAAVFKEF